MNFPSAPPRETIPTIFPTGVTPLVATYIPSPQPNPLEGAPPVFLCLVQRRGHYRVCVCRSARHLCLRSPFRFFQCLLLSYITPSPLCLLMFYSQRSFFLAFCQPLQRFTHLPPLDLITTPQSPTSGLLRIHCSVRIACLLGRSSKGFFFLVRHLSITVPPPQVPVG